MDEAGVNSPTNEWMEGPRAVDMTHILGNRSASARRCNYATRSQPCVANPAQECTPKESLSRYACESHDRTQKEEREGLSCRATDETSGLGEFVEAADEVRMETRRDALLAEPEEGGEGGGEDEGERTRKAERKTTSMTNETQLYWYVYCRMTQNDCRATRAGATL